MTVLSEVSSIPTGLDRSSHQDPMAGVPSSATDFLLRAIGTLPYTPSGGTDIYPPQVLLVPCIARQRSYSNKLEDRESDNWGTR